MKRRQLLLVLGGGLLGAAATLCGCESGRRRTGTPGFVVAPFAYEGTEAGLQRLWGDILAACTRDERGRVHDLMASLALTEDELAGLFGPGPARALWPRYQMLIGTLANVGAMELVAQILEKKYDDVAVVRVDQAKGEQQATDKQILRAMVQPTPLYTVRVKKKSEQKGLRYDFFVYLNGRWRTGNLLGKYLDEEPANKGG